MDNDDAGTERGHGPKKKTQMQIELLEKLYSEDKHPNQKVTEDCAEALNLTYNQVRKWFTDRRRKEKKENDRLISNTLNPRITRASAQSGNSGHGGKKAHAEHGGKEMGKNRYLGEEEMRYETSTKHSKLQRQQVKKSAGRIKRLLQKKPLLRLQVLFPKDYILKKVFRKDGPPLGVEFDCLPAKGFTDHDGLENHPHSSQCGERISKRQKVCDPRFSEMQAFVNSYAPVKRYGVGKGLMAVWHATNPNCQSLPTRIRIMGENISVMCSNEISKKKQNRLSQRSRNQELAMRQKFKNSSQEKRVAASIRKRKMLV